MKLDHNSSLKWLNHFCSNLVVFAFVLLLSIAQVHAQIVDSFNPNPQTGGNSLDGIAFEPDGSVLAFGIFATDNGRRQL